MPEVDRFRNWRALDLLTSAAVLITALVVIWPRVFGSSPSSSGLRSAPPLPTEPISIAGAPLKGSRAAAVAVIEFSEFQCPFSGRFWRDSLPDIAARYIDPGRVALVFRHLPLEAIHPFAFGAAAAATCAGEQGRFWEMHDRLFQDAKKLSPADLLSGAAAIGLSGDGFKSCLDGTVAANAIRADIEQAKKLQITGTPTFLVGVLKDEMVNVVKRIDGAKPADKFAAELDEVLRSVATAR